MTDTTTDFFDNISEGGGAPGAVLKNEGDFVHGTIERMFKREYVAFGQKEPEKREDGTVKEQLVIVLQTEHRNWENVSRVPKVDPADPNSAEKPASEDEGLRAIYVPEGKNIQFAIGRACATAKAKPEVGGTLGVRISKLRDTGKGNPLKEHEAVYEKPSAGAAFFGNAPSAPAESAPSEQPLAQGSSFGGGDRGLNSTPAPAAKPAPAAGDPWATPAAGGSEPPF